MLDAKVAIDTLTAAFRGPHGARTLHAKGRFYAATFTATAEAKALTRAAHMQGAPVPAWVRLSNGGGDPRIPDRAPDVRGLAISFRLPDGRATDLLGQTSPYFPVKTPEDFVAMVRATAGPGMWWRAPAFLATHPRIAATLIANVRAGAIAPRTSFAHATFYTVHAFQWLDAAGGARWVRTTIVPEAYAAPDERPPEDLHAELVARLATGPVRFKLSAQIADPEAGDDPNDPTTAWPAARRTVDVGVLEVTAPDAARETNGEIVVFDPTRILDGIALSDDPILRYRRVAYSESAGRRAR